MNKLKVLDLSRCRRDYAKYVTYLFSFDKNFFVFWKNRFFGKEHLKFNCPNCNNKSLFTSDSIEGIAHCVNCNEDIRIGNL